MGGIFVDPLEIPTLPTLPTGAGTTLPVPAADILRAPGIPPELQTPPRPGIEAPEADRRFLSNLTPKQFQALALFGAAITDAVQEVASKGQHKGTGFKTALSLQQGLAAGQREERAARTEERRAATEQERLDLERERVGFARTKAKQDATDQIYADAEKYLQGAVGLSDKDKAARENGLRTRMAAAAPENTVILNSMLTNREFAEDIRVLLPHMQPHERKALETNARAWLLKPEGIDQLRTAGENYASDDVIRDLTNRVILTARNERAAGVTGVIDRAVLRKAIANSPGAEATLALFDGSRFNANVRAAAESIITGGGFSSSTVAAKVAETTETERGKQAASGILPLIDKDVSAALTNAGFDPRKMRADDPIHQAALQAAERKVTEGKAEAERAKFAPDLVTLKVAAEQRTEEMKKQLDIKYRGTGSLTTSEIGALRDDYVKGSKNFIEARDAFARMDDLTKDPDRRESSAADVTRLYAYIKMQDPNAVREGELALVKGTGGPVDKAANLYNQLLQGTATLTATQRTNLEREVRGMFRTILTTQLDIETDYRGMAKKRSADPDEAVPRSVIGRFRDLPKAGASPRKGETPDERARRKFLAP